MFHTKFAKKAESVAFGAIVSPTTARELPVVSPANLHRARLPQIVRIDLCGVW
jgi:hypothetical protein